MPDHHYHANHEDAPARGSKAAAHKDARALHLYLNPPVVTAEDIKTHGADYPAVIRCWKSECVVRRG
jgi:hypothetical protein